MYFHLIGYRYESENPTQIRKLFFSRIILTYFTIGLKESRRKMRKVQRETPRHL